MEKAAAGPQLFPNLRRWFNAVRRRPATQRAYAKGEPYASRPAVTEEGKKILFGQTAQAPAGSPLIAIPIAASVPKAARLVRRHGSGRDEETGFQIEEQN